MGAVISASAHRDSETNEYDVRNMEIGRSKWPANDASISQPCAARSLAASERTLGNDISGQLGREGIVAIRHAKRTSCTQAMNYASLNAE